MIAQAMRAFACSLGPMAFTGSLLASATVTRRGGFFSSRARTQALFAVFFLFDVTPVVVHPQCSCRRPVAGDLGTAGVIMRTNERDTHDDSLAIALY
jgi:hypothetical protein